MLKVLWLSLFYVEDSNATYDQEIAGTSIPGEEESLIKASSKKISKLYEEKLSGSKRRTSRGSSLIGADDKIVFESLDPGTSYTITVTTMMNGIEIAAKEAKIYQMGN